MPSKATAAIARFAGVTSPPSFLQTTKPMPAKPRTRPSHCRAVTPAAPRAALLRVSQSAVSTGWRPTSSAAVPAPSPDFTAAQTPPRYAACISRPTTARWNHCQRPFGHWAPTIAIQTAKHAAESAKRIVRKPNGGACGIARRATTKPVDQMRTKSHGIARTKPGLSADTGANFRQGLLQVVDHRPDRQHRRHDDENGAPELGVDQPEQRAVIEQERDRDHLHDRLHLAEHVHGDAARRTDLRHPLAQGRDRDLAADDHERDESVQPAEVDEDEQRGGHQELVG